jgi:glycosyltransferase involved in cell wall biosynthesis
MFADRVVANSRQTLDWLLAQQPRLGPIAQVVCNGVTAPEHTPPEAVRRMRERAGGRDTDVLVSLVGRLNAWKGQAILLDAVARLEARGRAARLRVALVGSPFAGQEAILTELADHCRRLGLTDRVTFVPFIADIWPLWCATDIAVVPSTQPEPFGLVAIEAMAVAVPVVASGHGGLVDIVEEGRTGRLVEPGSSDALAAALEALVEDAALRRALGEAGRERQRRLFSAAAYLAGIERVYAEWEA